MRQVDCPECGQKLALPAEVATAGSAHRGQSARESAAANSAPQITLQLSEPPEQQELARRRREQRRRVRGIVLMLFGIVLLTAAAVWLSQW